MKAIQEKSVITVYEPNYISRIFVTDINNVAYCLSKFICTEAEVRTSDLFFNVLKKQKSIRAVIQKFNAICKALEL